MTFLHPWAFGLSAAAGVIVLLYLLKLRRRTLPVSTLWFWHRVLQEQRHRAWLQKLRRPFSLLLQLLIFTLVMLALARPLLRPVLPAGVSVVLVLDGRARMGAVEGDGRTRFATAVEEARALVQQASGDREMAVLLAGPVPRVAVPFTGDAWVLQQGLEQVRCTEAGGALEETFALAETLLETRTGERRMMVFTDRVLNAQGSNGIPRTYRAVGTAQDNVAITRFAARALPGSPDTCEVLLTVQNFGKAPAERELRLSLDGAPLEVRPLRLAPGAVEAVIFPTLRREVAARVESANRGWLLAQLTPGDALPSDDVAYAAVPPRETARVLLISKGNWFLEKLLAADVRVQFEVLQPESFQPMLTRGFDVVICDDFVPPEFDLETAQGKYLFMGRTPFASGASEVKNPIITEQSPPHPALFAVGLENVSLARAEAMKLPANEPNGWRWESPLRFLEQPLLIAGTRVRGDVEQRVMAAGWRVSDSDLPLRVAFPLFISQAVQWLAYGVVEGPATLRTGEALPLAAGQQVSAGPSLPGGATSSEAMFGGMFRPLQNGFYALRQGDRTQWVAVNTSDAAEADLRTGVAATSRGEAGRRTSSEWRWPNPGQWPAWQYLVLAAVLLYLGEWWLFHRRRTE